MFMMTMVATMVMAASLTLISFRRLPDLRTWALALGFQALGYVIQSLRGQIDDWLVILGARLISDSISLIGCCDINPGCILQQR